MQSKNLNQNKRDTVLWDTLYFCCLFTYFTLIIYRLQYNSIDTSNSNICPLMIILWRNILGHQQIALNYLLTTIPNRNLYCDGLILYFSRIRKMRRTENREQRTDREQIIQLQRPILSPMNCRVEQANTKLLCVLAGYN